MNKVYRLDSPDCAPLLRYSGHVIVQEKLDGSQFSVYKDAFGELHFRSRNKMLHYDPLGEGGLFDKAMRWCRENVDLFAFPFVYRGEAIKGPRHNHLTYENPPESGVVFFNVEGSGVVSTIGLPVVKSMMHWIPESNTAEDNLNFYAKLLEEREESMLGGVSEGIVIRPEKHVPHARDGSISLIGKLVSKEFKEEQGHSWKLDNPIGVEVRQEIGQKFAVPARFRKAVQRRRDDGDQEDSLRDIGPLLRSLSLDNEEEIKEEAMESLWKWARKDILRHSQQGFVEWYKEYLAELAVSEET